MPSTPGIVGDTNRKRVTHTIGRQLVLARSLEAVVEAIVGLVVRISVNRTNAWRLNALGTALARWSHALLICATFYVWARFSHAPDASVATFARLARVHLPDFVVLVRFSARLGASGTCFSNLHALRATVLGQGLLVLGGAIENGTRVSPTHRRAIVARAL